MKTSEDHLVTTMMNPPHLGELIRESTDEVGCNVTETAARLGCERGTLPRCSTAGRVYPPTWHWRSKTSARDRGSLDANAGEPRTAAGATRAGRRRTASDGEVRDPLSCAGAQEGRAKQGSAFSQAQSSCVGRGH